MNRIPCSVCVLTFNSGKTLERALHSVKDFDEIVINDGGSVDNTLEIAQKYNCRIIYQDKKFKNFDNKLIDFGGAKNQMLKASKYDWVLVVDSDEYLSQDLVKEIKHIDFSNTKILYNTLRKYTLNSELITLATTYPNYQIRLFNKTGGIKYIKKVHEKLLYNDDYQVRCTRHYFYIPLSSFEEFKRKGASYLKIQLSMWEEISLIQWFKIALFHLRASVSYFLRLILLQFKKGKKLPLKYELYRHYYNLVLIIKSIRKIKVR